MINAAGDASEGEERRRLGEQLPTTQVANGIDDVAACGVGGTDVLKAFDLDAGGDFRLGHEREFETAEQVAAETAEVITGERAAGGFVQFIAESDAEIVQGEAAVFAGKRVSETAEEAAEADDGAERQQLQHEFGGAEAGVLQPMCHAGGGAQARCRCSMFGLRLGLLASHCKLLIR